LLTQKIIEIFREIHQQKMEIAQIFGSRAGH